MFQSEDTDDVKNYAESTMGELFGMYGLKENTSESIVDSVPNKYFAAGKILEMSAYPQKRVMLNLTSSHEYQREASSSPEYIDQDVVSTSECSASQMHTQLAFTSSPTDSPTANEGIYAKILDNMKLNKGRILFLSN